MNDIANPQSKPDPNEKLVKVFGTEQEPEAMMVQGLLEEAGITSDLRSAELTQDTFPGLGGVEILVSEEDVEEAEKIIESYRQSPLKDDETAEINELSQPPE